MDCGIRCTKPTRSDFELKLWLTEVCFIQCLKKSSSAITGKVVFRYLSTHQESTSSPPKKEQQSRDPQSCLLDISQPWACNASFAGRKMVNLPIFPKLKDWVVKTFCAPYVWLTWQLLSSGDFLFRVGMWMYHNCNPRACKSLIC